MPVTARVVNLTDARQSFGDQREWTIVAGKGQYRDIPVPIIKISTDIWESKYAGHVDFDQTVISETIRKELGLIDELRLRPVISRGETDPPVNPQEYDRYLIPDSGATGAWAGHENQPVEFLNGEWVFTDLEPNMDLIIEDEDSLYTWDDDANRWIAIGGASTTIPASNVIVDTSNFDNILSPADNTAQKAFDTIDDHNHDPRYPRKYEYPGNPNGHVMGNNNDVCLDTVHKIWYSKRENATMYCWRVS